MLSSPALQRHQETQAELFRNAIALPRDVRRELVTSLLWSLPREDILHLNERVQTMLQKDIIGLLPPELAFMILGKLDLEDLLQCSLVSTTWASLCCRQALWALLCSSHSPPIRPLAISWAELSANRLLPPPADDPSDLTVDVPLSDERLSDHFSLQFRGIVSSSRLDPLGMAGGLRRNVWERGGAGEGLPVHLQRAFTAKQDENVVGNSPMSSHIGVPSARPQVNFKHLFIVHHILKKRMSTPRPVGPAGGYCQTQLDSYPPHSARRLPKPRTIDAISSIKHGGLPGHSEAVYALSVISHPMKIVNHDDATHPHPELHVPAELATGPEGHFQHSVMDMISLNGSVTSGSRRSSLGPSAEPRTVVNGRDWLLSGSRDKTLRLWQLSPIPRVVKILHGGHSGSVLTQCVVKVPSSSMSFSPHGKSRLYNLSFPPNGDYVSRMKVMAISGGSDGKICLWDIECGNGEPEKIIQAHDDSVLCVRAQGDRVVSCSKDKTIKLFDIKTLEEIMVIGGTEEDRHHRGAVNAVGLSKDFIVSASGDKTLRVWCVHTGNLLACLEGHQRGIASIDFDPSPSSNLNLPEGQVCKGVVITGSSDASIKTFLIIEHREDHMGSPDEEQSDDDSSMDSARNGELNHHHPSPPFRSARMVTALDGNGYQVTLEHAESFWSPCVCPSGLARIDVYGCTRCHNRGHLDLVRAVSLTSNVALSGSYDATVKIWDKLTGKIIADLSGAHTGRLFSVAGDRMRVISSGIDCRINIWDFSEGLDTSFVEP